MPKDILFLELPVQVLLGIVNNIHRFPIGCYIPKLHANTYAIVLRLRVSFTLLSKCVSDRRTGSQMTGEDTKMKTHFQMITISLIGASQLARKRLGTRGGQNCFPRLLATCVFVLSVFNKNRTFIGAAQVGAVQPRR